MLEQKRRISGRSLGNAFLAVVKDVDVARITRFVSV
jgi:hypothetical protein